MTYLSEKMEKMKEVIEKFDASLRNNNDSYKHYTAPDIPEKIQAKIIKYYDNNLPLTNAVAFYDTTVFCTAKRGFVFMKDGFYYKYYGKARYFQYKDIKETKLSNVSWEGLYFKLDSSETPEYTLIDALNLSALKSIIDEMIIIDAEYGQSSSKTTGKVKKIDIPPEMLKKCKIAIHAASAACGGVGTGLAQIPTSDSAVIVPIQISMIIGLGKIFALNITESMAKSILATAGSTIAGRTVSQVLFGWIPLVGNVVNTATAAGVTEVVGWIAVKNFYQRWVEEKNKGRFEGMKYGYSEASREYERKLKKQD